MMQRSKDTNGVTSTMWAERAPWAGLPDDARLAWESNGRHLQVDRDATVPIDVALVCRGALGLRRQVADGRLALTALYHDGDLIDLRRQDRRRQSTLVALTETDLLVFDPPAWDALRAPSASAALIFGQLHTQLARSDDHAADLALKTPLEKAASAVLEFWGWTRAATDAVAGEPRVRDDVADEVVELPLRQIAIAQYMGLTPETLSRAIRRLRDEGVIERPREDRLVIRDLPTLRQIANGGRPRRSTRSTGTT